MRICLFLVVLYLGLTAASYSYAGVFMCNHTSQKVNVAIGFMQGGKWLSKGWYRFDPNECDSLLLGVPENKNFYFYAGSSSGNSVWSGDKQIDAGYFCWDERKAFFYLNNTTKCDGRSFIRKNLGDSQQYWFSISEGGDPKTAAVNCSSEIPNGSNAFAKCWMRGIATEKQRRIIDCWNKTGTTASFSVCAAKDNLSPEAQRVADCASKYNKDRVVSRFATCIAGDKLSDTNRKLIDCALDAKTVSGAATCAAVGTLTNDQRRMVQCVAENSNNYVKIGTCLAADRLTPDQRRIADCVMENRTSYVGMGICAAGKGLTPEQQAFAQCAMTTGGQPYAFAGCVGTQLTLNELDKCMTSGIGGRGCFGDNNTAVKFVTNAFKDITEGPGPSNDLFGRDGWVGRTLGNAASDLQNGAGSNNDIVGEDGWVCENLFGGC